MDYKRFAGIGIRYGAGLVANRLASQFIGTPSQRGTQDDTGLQLYRNMQFYLKRRQASRTRVRRVRRKRRGGPGSGGGIIGPVIPQPPPPRPPSKYDLYGSRGQDEMYYTSSRASINYVGMTSFKCTHTTTTSSSVSGSLSYHVAAALLRHIMKKEFNADYLRHSQLIGLARTNTGATTSSLLKPKIVFVSKMRSGSHLEADYAADYVLDLKNCTTFADAAKLVAKNVICATNFGGNSGGGASDQDNQSLAGYYIVEPDASGAATVATAVSNVRLGEFTRLDDMYIRAYSVAELAIQNVTVSDNTADDTTTRLADRIDSNPLQCRLFKFSTPMPDLRDPIPVPTVAAGTGFATVPTVALAPNVTDANAWRLSYDQNGDGVINPNFAWSPSGDFDQLPSASRWKHLTGMTDFVLGPGEIRKFYLKFKFDGLLQRFISGQGLVDLNYYTRGNDRGALGTSVLVAAEKVMSSGTNTDVSINFQVSYYAGAHVKKPKRSLMLPYDKDGAYTGDLDTGLAPS